jgi:hypothetical protein
MPRRRAYPKRPEPPVFSYAGETAKMVFEAPSRGYCYVTAMAVNPGYAAARWYGTRVGFACDGECYVGQVYLHEAAFVVRLYKLEP